MNNSSFFIAINRKATFTPFKVISYFIKVTAFIALAERVRDSTFVVDAYGGVYS
jgi:hypothetical protein